MLKNSSAKFIFITIFIDMLGIGIIIPILPQLIHGFVPDAGEASQYFGYFISVYSLIQFFASPVLGALADRFGRRPILLISLLGAAVDYLIMAFAPTLLVLFLGRIVSGLTGASGTVASAYMADVSDDKNRSANFGLIGAAFGLGFIFGPAIGGIVGTYGWRYPFFAAALLNFANFLFGIFILPESLPIERRRKIDFNKLSPLKSSTRIFRMPQLLPLVLIYFLLYFAGQVHPSNWTLYTQYKFGWTTRDVGLSLAVVGLSIAVVQGGLTRVLIPKLGEWRSVLYGSAGGGLAYLGYSLAPKGWMMFAILVPSALASISGPALQSLVSKDVPSNEQGELQGSLMSLASLTSIVGPLVYTSLFAAYTNGSGTQFSGIAYFVAAIISFVAAGFALKLYLKVPYVQQ